ncbi:MAG: MFS transporter [Bryobacteraceae bacterium]|nr:MFS transporter [Bryobacteraceae bacterium]
MTATHVRFRVVAFAVALAGVTYLDRVCISVLAPDIMRDLGLSRMQMSYVFSAFTLAYAAFEIPTAAWADKIGSRAVLTRIVLWWSAFTMVTAAAVSYWMLLVVRFLFGIGEAGAWPNAARVFSRWVPANERGRVQGIFFAGAHLAGGLTPGLVAAMAVHLHWRVVFVLFGFIGVAWAAAWYWWFRDEPRDHKSVSADERDYIEANRGLPPAHSGGSWASVFRTRSLFPLCLQYVANTYGFYFFITWLPTYLMNARGMSKGELAIFSGLPLLLSVFADITGGMTTDALSRRFGIRVGRCGVGVVGYLVAAIAMFGGAVHPDARTAGFLIAIGGAASMLTLAPAWATAIDLGGRNSGVLSATMNTAGQIGGILSPIVLAYVVDTYGNWSLPLQILAGLYFISAICWLVIHPTREEAVPQAGSGGLTSSSR